MASTARTLGAFIHRVSLSRGFSSSLSSLKNSSTFQRFCLFEKKATVGDVLRLRRIWTSPPVCMGRRSCKIAGRKDAQNLKKMKRNGKIGKEIVAAYKYRRMPLSTAQVILVRYPGIESIAWRGSISSWIGIGQDDEQKYLF